MGESALKSHMKGSKHAAAIDMGKKKRQHHGLHEAEVGHDWVNIKGESCVTDRAVTTNYDATYVGDGRPRDQKRPASSRSFVDS